MLDQQRLGECLIDEEQAGTPRAEKRVRGHNRIEQPLPSPMGCFNMPQPSRRQPIGSEAS